MRLGLSVVAVVAALAAQPLAGLAQSSDPLTVMQQFIAAENAGDIEQVMSFWADDAAIVNTRGRRVTGKDAIRGFFKGNMARGMQHTLASPVVNGDKVTWQLTDDTDFYAKLGVAPVRILSEATVRDRKIVSYIGYIPPPEIDRIEAACRRPEASEVRLFGQTCSEFVNAARVHTNKTLGR